MYVAGLAFLAVAAVIIVLLFGPEGGPKHIGWKIYSCIVIGMVSGMAIGKVTEYFTSFDFGPVISIKDRAVTGPATVVIQGLGVGMISCVPPTVILVFAIIACNALAEAYGAVADNAGGLAELAGLGSGVRDKTDSLDALG